MGNLPRVISALVSVTMTVVADAAATWAVGGDKHNNLRSLKTPTALCLSVQRMPRMETGGGNFLSQAGPKQGGPNRFWGGQVVVVHCKSSPVEGSSTAGRFESCFSFSLAKGNVDSRKKIHDSSSNTIDVNFVHILYVNY